MKKSYLTPESTELKLISEPIMNVISGETGGAGTGSGSAGDEDPEVTSRHRGEWGSLWK